jgi:hypothetical protein
MTAQQECAALKLQALSDAELAHALERIVAKIPPRYPDLDQPAIVPPKKNGASGRPRQVQEGAKGVAA